MSNPKEFIDMLGCRGKDRVTGFCGVITSVSFDLYGCVQFVVTPELDKDGKLADGRWMDENRIELISSDRVMPVPGFVRDSSQPAPRVKETISGPADKPARSR